MQTTTHTDLEAAILDLECLAQTAQDLLDPHAPSQPAWVHTVQAHAARIRQAFESHCQAEGATPFRSEIRSLA